MDITKQIKLNLQNPGNPAIVHAKQGDKDSRILEITLYDGATAYEIPAGATVQIEGTKPDKTSFMYGGTIADGVVSITLKPQVLTVAGIVPVDIVLYSGTQRLSSFRMDIIVQKKSFDDEATPSEDYIEPFSELVDELMRVKGAPLVANTAAGMTDTERIYVYTGSETGYVAGNWYYYDGSSWLSGGVYNSQAISDSFRDEIADMVKQSAVATESDSTPYLYRPTPNPSAILADEEIVGGTIAFNQLCNSASVTVPNGHKYYLLKAGASSITASTGSAVTGLDDGTDMVIDLTAMLGSTIADYLNTLESGTAGAGVAKLREWGFLSKEYFAYDAGSLKSVNTEGKRVTGKNLYLYDEDNADTAPNTNNQTRGIYHTGYGGGTYSLSAYKIGDAVTTSNINVGYLQNGIANVVNDLITSSETKQRTVVVPQGAELILMSASASVTGITNNLPKYDIQIEYGSNVTSYEPYRSTLYPTTPTDLNGIFYLDENNQLRTKGDVYHASGVIDRKFAEMTFDGTENWAQSSADNSVFYLTMNSTNFPYLFSANVNALSVAFVFAGTAPSSYATALASDKTFLLYYASAGVNAREIAVRDNSITTLAAWKTYLENNPLTVLFELASAKQTTDTADPYPATQIAPKGGTEERIDNRSVPVPVGHRTVYSIGVPDVPAANGTYRLTATVASGKTSMGWSS